MAHAGGRPVLYSTVEEMQKKIDDYFKSCWKAQTDKSGNIVYDTEGNIVYVQYRPYTMAGLADALGMSRQSLLNYQSKDKKFFDTITRARRKVEVYAEEQLYNRDATNGAKFSLQNNFRGWTEKAETNVNAHVDVNYESLLKEIEEKK